MSILIKNVQIVDGTGSEPYNADVFVDKNLISAIGNLKSKEATEVIEGAENYLTPGFVDLASSADHDLSIFLNSPKTKEIKNGVTTILGGHGGVSLAPLIYGSLDLLRPWGDVSRINVDWHSVGEFMQTLTKLQLGVNFGTLVGYQTVREALIHNEKRPLAKDELKVFKKILIDSLDQGALGLSIDGEDNSSRSEIKELLEIVKNYGAIYSVYLRKGDRAKAEEALSIAREIGVKTLICLPRGEENAESVEKVGGDALYAPYPFLDNIRSENLSAAVKNITSIPAEFLGLKDRGIIKEGKVADLTILDKNDYKKKEVILKGIRI